MISCGVDIVEIERLEKLNPKIRSRFLKRVFTQNELDQSKEQNQHLCGLFAAKEAVSKALGTGIGLVAWQDIEILHAPSGEPSVHLHRHAHFVAEQKGLIEWSVSISHDRDKAVAVAVALSKVT